MAIKQGQKKIAWTPEDRKRHQAIREAVKDKPSIEELVACGELRGQPVPLPGTSTLSTKGLNGGSWTLVSPRSKRPVSTPDAVPGHPISSMTCLALGLPAMRTSISSGMGNFPPSSMVRGRTFERQKLRLTYAGLTTCGISGREDLNLRPFGPEAP